MRPVRACMMPAGRMLVMWRCQQQSLVAAGKLQIWQRTALSMQQPSLAAWGLPAAAAQPRWAKEAARVAHLRWKSRLQLLGLKVVE